MGVYPCICVRVHVFGCVLQRLRTHSCDPNSVTGEFRFVFVVDPIRQAIRRLTHVMIWRSVPVRAVKTRRRFGFKTGSFHVSVCSYVFLYLLLPVDVSVSICIILCDCMIYFTSMITRITSSDTASVYFHIIVNCRYLMSNYYRVPIVFMLVNYCF